MNHFWHIYHTVVSKIFSAVTVLNASMYLQQLLRSRQVTANQVYRLPRLGILLSLLSKYHSTISWNSTKNWFHGSIVISLPTPMESRVYSVFTQMGWKGKLPAMLQVIAFLEPCGCNHAWWSWKLFRLWQDRNLFEEKELALLTFNLWLSRNQTLLVQIIFLFFCGGW